MSAYIVDLETIDRIVTYVEEFLARYYKPERYTGRGEEYAAILLASHKADLSRYGVDWISHHDSVTGKVVAFYDRDFSASAEAVLATMKPGKWYQPAKLKAAAGIDRKSPGFGDILTRMCEAGLLAHGNGTTTSGFCRPVSIHAPARGATADS